MSFIEANLKELQLNPFNMFLSEWGLVSAGTAEKRNGMTIGWGTLGILWGKPVALVFIRPQRFTKEFVEESDRFTVSFYPPDYKGALELLGTKSGRDGDKIAESGLTPYYIGDTLAFEEAHSIYVCKKLYGGHAFDPAKFVDTALMERVYAAKDYHYLYVGEIEKLLVKAPA